VKKNDGDVALMRMSDRIVARLQPAALHLPPGRYWVAGGAFIRDGNDVDIFCPDGFRRPAGPTLIVSDTPNAITFKCDGKLFQICRATAPTLRQLLESFDFAHCQIGCEAQISGGSVTASLPDWTEAYQKSRCTGTTWYVGSETPLRSLVRVNQYVASGVMSLGAAFGATLDILRATVKRGFNGRSDFQEQLAGMYAAGCVAQADVLDELFTLLDKGTKAP
jgi:hypothetical protein